jgi:glycosyltransferase involved in cell wall biosynthesis
MIDKKRMLWVTNMPAPYRLPIFDLLGEVYDLEVCFLLGQNNWRNWNLDQSPRNWKFRFLKSRTLLVKELELIVHFGFRIRNLQNYDVIVLGSWENPAYLSLLARAKKLKKISVGIYESHLKSQKFKRGLISSVRAKFFRSMTFSISFGPGSTYALEQMGVKREAILELFNLVDNDWFRVNSKHPEVELHAGHIFLYVGRLIQIKNIESAIYAFSSIASKFDLFQIVGEGKQLQALKTLVQKLGLEHQVEFLGHLSQEKLARVYASAQTLVLPSENEVWGLVVNEALACGLHAVVSDQAGVAEAVKTHRGVYVSATDFQNLASAMSASKNDWDGWISDPEISHLNVETFVDRVVKQIEVVFIS